MLRFVLDRSQPAQRLTSNAVNAAKRQSTSDVAAIPGTVDEQVAALDVSLSGQIAALAARVTSLEDRMSAAEARLDALEGA